MWIIQHAVNQKNMAMSPPGNMLARCRISHVQLMPTLGNALPASFLAVQGKSVYMWDLNEAKVSGQTEVSNL